MSNEDRAYLTERIAELEIRLARAQQQHQYGVACDLEQALEDAREELSQ